MLLDCWIQCVSLPCPQAHWNMRYSFALFPLNADKGICWWFINRSLTQWSCLSIGIYPSHEERIFKTISMFVKCFITDVNLADETLDVLFSPTVHQLRSTVNLVVLPWVQYRGKFAAVFWCFSSCIHGFGMICLPWIMSTFSPSWQDCCGTKAWTFQRCKSCSHSLHRTFIGSKPYATLTHVQSLWYELQSRRTQNSRRCLFQID